MSGPPYCAAIRAADNPKRLEDLYRKRCSWDKLFDLYSADLEGAEGGAKLSLLKELAQLPAFAILVLVYGHLLRAAFSKIEASESPGFADLCNFRGAQTY